MTRRRLVVVLAWGAIALGELTGINAGVWALLLGLGGRAVGILPDATLLKANAFGMTVIIMVVLGSMATASWSSVIASFVPAMTVLLAREGRARGGGDHGGHLHAHAHRRLHHRDAVLRRRRLGPRVHAGVTPHRTRLSITGADALAAALDWRLSA